MSETSKPAKSRAGVTRTSGRHRAHFLLSSILGSAVLCNAAYFDKPAKALTLGAEKPSSAINADDLNQIAAEINPDLAKIYPGVDKPASELLTDEPQKPTNVWGAIAQNATKEKITVTIAPAENPSENTHPSTAKVEKTVESKAIAPPTKVWEAIAISAKETAKELKPHSSDRLLAAQPTQQLAQINTFPDVQGHWAQTFIEALAARDIIRGFPDGTYRPDEPLTRAQFAALIRKAFPGNSLRNPIQFVDVPRNYWAYDAIQEAYQIGFLEGYPNNIFAPEQNIPRVQVLVSVANGLNLTAQTNATTVVNRFFQDASQIPNYAVNSVAAATENRLVVNYPNVAFLSPNQIATRADVAAFLYQALVSNGTLPPLPPTDIATRYIVGYEPPIAQPPIPQPPTESLEALQRRYLLQEPTTLEVPTVGIVAAPGSSSGSPTAFGASWGRVFAGLGFQARTRYTDEADGSLSVGLGLGDAQKLVGVEVTAAALSLLGDDAFERGGISFKVHRLFPENFAVAVGVENAIVWGSTDAGSSVYGVASKIFQLRETTQEPFSQVTVSLGLGGGRFRSENDIENDEGNVNVFGSVGLRVIEPVSLIADWTGQDLTLGASIAPFRNFPLVITPAVADITGNAGDGARFILGIGYNFSFPTGSR